MNRSLALRKQAAIVAKLDGLSVDLAGWRALTNAAGSPFARHWSQVDVVTRTLDAAIAGITETAGALRGAEAEVIDGCARAERQLTDVHRAWDYFAGKLTQRSVEAYRPYLIAADELAWECYGAAQKAADPELVGLSGIREPPLTFLNGGRSPFLLARGESYAAVLDGEPRDGPVRTIVETLPVPVIGLPWHQLGHAPDALVVVHEAAHAVEEDLRLGPGLRDAIAHAGVDCRRASGWAAWSSEIFADVFGTLAAGPAYTAALAELAARRRGEVVSARRVASSWGEYPTPTLRVLLSAAVARDCGCGTAADAIVTDWRAAYPGHAMQAWEPDVERVARAVVAGPYPQLRGCGLDKVIRFDATDWAAVVEDAQRMLDGAVPVETRVRALLGSAKLAFDADPERYRAHEAAAATLKRIESTATSARRRAREGLAEPLQRSRGEQVVHRVVAVLDEPEPLGVER